MNADERPILIADDDADDRYFAIRALEHAGFDSPILTCSDGREVVALLRERLKGPRSGVPRAVFLDIKMPVMTGFEILKWIRHEPELTDVVVIMLTGSKDSRDTELALTLGADGYLVKFPASEAFLTAITSRPAAPMAH